MSNCIINLTNICYQKNQRVILNNINLTICKKSILTIVGPNGAGKTTLLKIILNQLTPTAGQITRANNLTISLVPQHLQMPADLPITAQRFLKDLPINQNWLIDLNLQNKLQTPLQLLSGGELQRLLFLRAIAKKPDLLVLDEPASGIDPMSLTKFYSFIKKAQQELSCSVVMVSHDLHLIMAQSDKVLCINRHICCQGSPENIRNHPEFNKIIGKELSFYQHHHQHSH